MMMWTTPRMLPTSSSWAGGRAGSMTGMLMAISKRRRRAHCCNSAAGKITAQQDAAAAVVSNNLLLAVRSIRGAAHRPNNRTRISTIPPCGGGTARMFTSTTTTTRRCYPTRDLCQFHSHHQVSSAAATSATVRRSAATAPVLDCSTSSITARLVRCLSTAVSRSDSSSAPTAAAARSTQKKKKTAARTTARRTPVVAILGPPNAGKSTLFNRLLCREANRSYRLGTDKKRRRGRGRGRRTSALLGRRATHANALAIVSEVAGTTRDRRECVGFLAGAEFQLWDTPGVESALTAQQLLHRDGELQREQEEGDGASHRHRHRHRHRLKPRVRQSLQYAMMQHTLQAARDADLVLLMMDAKHAGVTSDLWETSQWLRQVSTRVETRDRGSGSVVATRTRPQVVLVANKLEGSAGWDYEGSHVLENLDEAERRLGFGPPVLVSAIHGDGMADLAVIIHELQRQLDAEDGIDGAEDDDSDNDDDSDSDYASDSESDEEESDESSDDDDEEEYGSSDDDEEDDDDDDGKDDDNASLDEKPLQLAILGRQNVGKSTLVNALLGESRCLTGATPGLTRDAISAKFQWRGRPVQIVDTAGIRRRAQRDHHNEIEDLAVQDALRAMKVADVAVLVLDAGARMLQRQELAIADAILKEGRSIVVAANKMDLIVEEDYSKEEFVDAVRAQLEGRFPGLRQTPIVAMSSLYNQQSVHDLMPVVFDARDRWQRTISTGQLNRWIKEVRHGMAPPTINGQQVKIKYMLQTKGRPPTFLLYCSTDEIPTNYARFLMRHFQDSFKMFGMEVRLAIKKSAKENPFDSTPGKPKRSGFGVGGREARHKRKRARLRELFGGAKNKEEYRARMMAMPKYKKRQLKSKRKRK